ncbi:hypothetical protein ACN47E_006263 [Coniothyrium glycines]
MDYSAFLKPFHELVPPQQHDRSEPPKSPAVIIKSSPKQKTRGRSRSSKRLPAAKPSIRNLFEAAKRSVTSKTKTSESQVTTESSAETPVHKTASSDNSKQDPSKHVDSVKYKGKQRAVKQKQSEQVDDPQDEGELYRNIIGAQSLVWTGVPYDEYIQQQQELQQSRLSAVREDEELSWSPGKT